MKFLDELDEGTMALRLARRPCAGSSAPTPRSRSIGDSAARTQDFVTLSQNPFLEFPGFDD